MPRPAQRGGARRDERGAALVECALVFPILLVMLLGMVEMGNMTRTQMALSQAAREGAQATARGMSVERVTARTLNTAERGGLAPNAITGVALEHSSNNGAAWQPIGNKASGAENNAGRRNLVRVTVRYRHAHVSRVVFQSAAREMSSAVAARRK